MDAEYSWQDVTHMKVAAFCDASTQAMSQCRYMLEQQAQRIEVHQWLFALFLSAIVLLGYSVIAVRARTRAAEAPSVVAAPALASRRQDRRATRGKRSRRK